MVLKLERQYNATHVDESKGLINVSDARKFSVKGNRGAGVSNMSGKSSDYKNKECSHCGRICRPIDVCYKKHDFSSNYGKTYSANNTSIEQTDEKEDVDDCKSSKENDSFGFTREQYEKLVGMLQSSNKVNVVNHTANHLTSGITQMSLSMNDSSLGSWIVDSMQVTIFVLP